MKIKAKRERTELQLLLPQVIFENKTLIVVSKPAGWIVNSSQTTTDQSVIQDWLAQNFDFPVFEYPECRNGIVHRLDKPTSGCLIVAKTKSSFESLQSQFKERTVNKKYTALSHGKSKDKSGLIDQPVGRLPWRRDRFGVLSGGRPAQTNYEVLGYYQKDGQEFTLFELSPHTGRTHQIRIHLKYIGHPIVSDTFYAGRKTARSDLKWCSRLFLHASKIEFSDPDGGEKIRTEAALPVDLESALDKCVQ